MSEEEDGLMLNFSTEPVAGTVSKRKVGKVTGGSWKDRRRAQLVSQGRGRNTKRNISDVNGIPVNQKKTQDVEEKLGSSEDSVKLGKDKKRVGNVNSLGPSSKKIRFQEQSGQNGGKNNTYVSSLFTSNTEIVHKKEEESEVQILAPSNAPLVDATTFDGLGVEKTLAQHLTNHLNFAKPTKIQRSVLPRLLLRERDLFIQSQTGSGKTLAFVLPIFQKLMEITDLNRTTGLFAVILTPTRELASQIHSVLETLTRCCHRIVPGIVIGGEKKKAEKARLRKGVNILVATPGRLADHIENTETLNLSQVRYLVLDEGDRLMELGFEETILKILTKISNESNILATTKLFPNLPKKRVNVLCSATIKSDVKKLGEISLQDAELVTNASSNEEENVVEFHNETAISAPDQLLQQVLIVSPKLRLVSLAAILRNITRKGQPGSRTMVFFSCSDSVDFHFSTFTKRGKKFKKIKVQNEDSEDFEEKIVYENADESSTVVTSPLLGGESTIIFKLHGSLNQMIRTSTLSHFTKAQTKNTHVILFCTDVASRGLDLPHISTVVEYDPPFSVDDHLHRVGRTARAGKAGTSLLFLLPGLEEAYAEYIKPYHPSGLKFTPYEDILKEGFGSENSDDTEDKKRKQKKREDWDTEATTWHLDVERWLLEDPIAHDKAVQGFSSHIRAYATHLASERSIFNVKTLHLGHLAKSFGLRETPKNLGKYSGNDSKQKDGSDGGKKKEDPRQKMLRMASQALKSQSSEFNFM
ncbi:hypothetical protein PACTADRAFT_49674 [Pachysolen tannophilus NRRL Y-2460]|uniref:ATP-dependent RNA helicase n=1 Tax=Pachysolen tannophilus NRRL Y-2460 TaxID=669874 RepID=A0A1E4TWZ4_PACTA|nr:hypothetical protein PACTADRAFT_49674 [Pachysolen tannophilus NRRL Y-2460]